MDRRFRFVAISGTLAVAMHLPLRGGWRSRSRVVAAGMLVVGAVGLRADTGWVAWLTLGGSLGRLAPCVATPRRTIFLPCTPHS